MVGAADRRGKLPVDLRAGLDGRPLGEAIEHLFETFSRKVLVGVVPDQHHRRVDAGAEALDLLPRKIAVGRDVERVVMDALLADVENGVSAAQPARRRAADLHMGLLPARLQQEHGVERRHFQRADMRHAEHLGHVPDRRLRQPATVLFLRTPKQRDDRRLLAARRILRNLLLRPRGILRREGEFLRLNIGRGKAADGHDNYSGAIDINDALKAGST